MEIAIIRTLLSALPKVAASDFLSAREKAALFMSMWGSHAAASAAGAMSPLGDALATALRRVSRALEAADVANADSFAHGGGVALGVVALHCATTSAPNWRTSRDGAAALANMASFSGNTKDLIVSSCGPAALARALHCATQAPAATAAAGAGDAERTGAAAQMCRALGNLMYGWGDAVQSAKAACGATDAAEAVIAALRPPSLRWAAHAVRNFCAQDGDASMRERFGRLGAVGALVSGARGALDALRGTAPRGGVGDGAARDSSVTRAEVCVAALAMLVKRSYANAARFVRAERGAGAAECVLALMTEAMPPPRVAPGGAVPGGDWCAGGIAAAAGAARCDECALDTALLSVCTLLLAHAAQRLAAACSEERERKLRWEEGEEGAEADRAESVAARVVGGLCGAMERVPEHSGVQRNCAMALASLAPCADAAQCAEIVALLDAAELRFPRTRRLHAAISACRAALAARAAAR